MPPIRVVLADDHAVVRKGIHDFLSEDEDIDVVGEANDGAKVKDLILSLQPDVAILDIRMPQATGIEVTKWVREQRLPTRVLILTAFDDDPFVIAALQAGAHGYVLKDAEAEDIVAAVHGVYSGHSVLNPKLAQKLLLRTTQSSSGADDVTDREREVLQLTAFGLTNRGIAAKLSISERTVQGHLASVFSKLQVNSRTEAVTKGLEAGLIHLRENDK